ncbi:MAG: HNH endonuclease [Lachnospiraceae bacterium]|nr:HNH endonuclease [Robinsoniella sp.]MDY3766090.1 HNH endonuclease [Lachnospiraceae bacterium]
MREIKSEIIEKKNIFEKEKEIEVKMRISTDISADKIDELYRKITETNGERKRLDNNIQDTKGMYSSLDEMKNALGKSYRETKAEKPLHSPNLSKWFENGGKVAVEERNGQSIWTYRDSMGKEVTYIDGYPVFPPESKHPIIPDMNIGMFTGDRQEDKKIYLERLEEECGLTEIPEKYQLHHDQKNGEMQLIKEEYHKEFTHSGGHSLYKEMKEC